VTKRWVGVAVAVLVMTAGVGCSSDEPEVAEATTTTEAEATTTAPTTTALVVDDEEFTSRVDQFGEQLDAASASACDLIGQLSTALPTPTTAAQARDAVRALTDLFTRLADAAPPEAASSAATFREIAAALPGEAEALGYDPLKLPTAPSLQAERLGTAMTDLVTAAGCVPEDAPGAGAGAGTPGG